MLGHLLYVDESTSVADIGPYTEHLDQRILHVVDLRESSRRREFAILYASKVHLLEKHRTFKTNQIN